MSHKFRDTKKVTCCTKGSKQIIWTTADPSEDLDDGWAMLIGSNDPDPQNIGWCPFCGTKLPDNPEAEE